MGVTHEKSKMPSILTRTAQYQSAQSAKLFNFFSASLCIASQPRVFSFKGILRQTLRKLFFTANGVSVRSVRYGDFNSIFFTDLTKYLTKNDVL